MDVGAQSAFGEESFGVGRVGVGGRQGVFVPLPFLMFASQTRREESQVSGQLLCLPEREVHPHDLDLRQRGRLRERRR